MVALGLRDLQLAQYLPRVWPMVEREDTDASRKPVQQAAWRDRIRADLAAQVEAGGTLYGYRQDGAYVARTRRGDEIVTPGASKSA